MRGYITNQFTEKNHSKNELNTIHKRLIYNHIGWIYSLRSQLLVPTPWEHASQNSLVKKYAERTREVFGVGLFGDDITENQLI